MNNFEIMKEYKLNWIKAITKDAEPQKHVINNCALGNVIIKTVVKGHAWVDVKPEQLLKLVEKNRYIQEVLAFYPFKVYFDIDKHSKDEELLNKIVDIVNKYFPDPDIAVSGSIFDKKTSYHIVANNYLIKNINDHKYLKSIVSLMKQEEESFDLEVYKKNQAFKAVNQSKPDKRIQNKLINDDLKKHLLTCYFNDDTLELPKYETEDKQEIQIQLNVQRAKKPFDLSTLPNLPAINIDLKSDINIYTPLELLSLLPLNNTFNHGYTHQTARFCYYNDLSFEHFISWYQQKSNSQTNYNNWKTHWERIESDKFPAVYKSTIINILVKYYPDIKKSIKCATFEKQFKLKNTINIDTLDQSVFESEQKFIILNTSMGSGKTYQTIKYLKDKESFIWMTPIIALAQNTKFRLEEEQIECHYYKDNSRNLHKHDKLIVCLNSIQKTEDKLYKIVIIDEIETFLFKWFNNSTLNESQYTDKLETWERFLSILRNADKVIFLDAFTSKKTLNFIEQLKTGDYIIYNSKPLQTINREVILMPGFCSWLKDIIDSLNRNEKSFIFFPFKDAYRGLLSMSDLVKYIEKKTNKIGLYYNGEQNDKILEGLRDVNNSWSAVDFVLTNSKITVGINYELKDFDIVYLSIAGFNSTRDIIQVSYRCRSIKSNKIKVCYIDKDNLKYTKEDEDENRTILNDNRLVNDCIIYKQLVEDIRIEKQAPLQASFNHFCKLANYSITASPEVIEEGLEQYFKNEFDECKLDYSYSSIPNIETIDIYEQYEQRIFRREATTLDKVMLRKYWYQKKFKTNSDEDILAEAWEKRYIPFFNAIVKLKEDDNNIYEKIKTLNKWNSIIPSDEELNKVILTSELIKTIFEEYHFAKLTEKSGARKIIKNIYNTFFGKRIIESRIDKSRNVKFTISETTRTMFDFGMCNLLQHYKKERGLVGDPFLEDSKLDILEEEEEDEKVINKKLEPLVSANKINKNFFTLTFNDE